jgi:hypothetical protein
LEFYNKRSEFLVFSFQFFFLLFWRLPWRNSAPPQGVATHSLGNTGISYPLTHNIGSFSVVKQQWRYSIIEQRQNYMATGPFPCASDNNCDLLDNMAQYSFGRPTCVSKLPLSYVFNIYCYLRVILWLSSYVHQVYPCFVFSSARGRRTTQNPFHLRKLLP